VLYKRRNPFRYSGFEFRKGSLASLEGGPGDI
jgi:hypothetical protein